MMEQFEAKKKKKCSAIVCKMLEGFTHGSLVKLDLSLGEIGHLLERVD